MSAEVDLNRLYLLVQRAGHLLRYEYGKAISPNGKWIEKKAMAIRHEFADAISNAYKKWKATPELSDAVREHIDGKPDAWFVRLWPLLRTVNYLSELHPVRMTKRSTIILHEELAPYLDELRQYEHTLDVAIARLRKPSAVDNPPTEQGKRQKQAARIARVRALCDEHNLHGQNAKLRDTANADAQIMALGLDPLTAENCRKMTAKPKTKRKMTRNSRR